MKKENLSLIVAILMLAVLFTGCGGQSAPATPTQPAASVSPDSTTGNDQEQIDTLIIGSTMDVRSYGRSDLTYNIFSGTITHMALTYLDENEIVQPLMADFESEDAKTWTFTINADYKWHDGVPVTSEDVKFTAEYLYERYSLSFYDSIEAINIIDDKTFEFVYKEPNIRALYNGIHSFRILPKHIFDFEHDYKEFNDIETAIGSGPYKLVDFDLEAGILEYGAFEEFPWGAPNVQTIIIRLFKNADSMYMALKNEEIDMIWAYGSGVNPNVIEDLKASGNIELKPIYNAGNPYVILFNNDKFPGNDLNFRKAIAYAIDYDKCRELFGTQFALPANYSHIPNYVYGFIDTDPLSRDLEAGRAALIELGAVDSNGDGIFELDGEPLKLEFTTTAAFERVAEFVVGNVRELGIDASFQIVDAATTFRTVTETERSFTATVQRFTAAGINGSPGLNATYFDSREFMMGYGNVTDPVYHDIVDRLGRCATMDEYLGISKECQEYFAENLPAIALYWDGYIMAYNSKLQGFVVDGMFSISNMQTWYNISAG